MIPCFRHRLFLSILSAGIVAGALVLSAAAETPPASPEALPDNATVRPEAPRQRRVKSPISKKSVMLGIGGIASYAVGGGDTHPGLEHAGINPVALLSVSYFFIDGLAIGIQGTHQYITTTVRLQSKRLPLAVSTSVTAMGGAVGIGGNYFFHATPVLFPYLGLFLQYGMAGGKVPNLGSTRFSFINVGIAAGLTWVVTDGLGLCIEATHMRDIVDPGEANRHGHLTGIGIGFRLFI